MDLHDALGKPGGKLWKARTMVVPHGDHHLVGLQLAEGSKQRKPAVALHYPLDVDPFAQWGVEAPGVAFEIGHYVVPQHKAVGIVAVIRKAGKLALPVWRHQAEVIPALLPPGPGQTMAFQHNMTDVFLRQAPAHGKTGLTAANNDDRIGVCIHRFLG